MKRDGFLYNLRRVINPFFDMQEYEREQQEYARERMKYKGFINYRCPYCNSIISKEIYSDLKNKLKYVASSDQMLTLSHKCTHKLQPGEEILYQRISYSPEPLNNAVKVIYIDKKEKQEI